MADKSLPWGLKSAKIASGSAKSIPESKMKAFESGSMHIGKKSMSKREQEEYRRKLDEVETAQVYQDFVAAFEDTTKQNKAWVRGGTFNPEKAKDKSEKAAGALYKPKSKLAELAATFQSVKEAKKSDDKPFVPTLSQINAKKKKEENKKKSNLEMFKEELKAIQEERKERHHIKKMMKGPTETPEDDPTLELMLDDPDMPRGDALKLGSYDPGDENTTNIYVGNINPKMSEQQLCEEFGRFGPLASVKIMWPRTDEERSRGRNCGFVAFMNRKDGERAMNTLKGKDVMNFEMKLGWGKAVPIPPHPIYIPPALAELTQPPPPSGLPFNAQMLAPGRSRGFGSLPPAELDRIKDDPVELEKTLANAVVKVVIPTERSLLCVIHRMVEFVVREGPMFEAMIMNREINNPTFRFLFNNRNPAHTYYRWKLFSILQGDSPYKWRTDEFRMFKGGSVWRPPPMNPYTQGMPEELVEKSTLIEEVPQQPTKGQLTDSQRDRLEDMLRDLTPERAKIADGMVWCLDHAESAEEVVECITEALSIIQTPIPKKIARLFLVSDILFNSSAKVPNASFYRKYFQEKLIDIFKDVRETYEKIDGRLKAEQFKQKVMSCFRAWEDWAVYPNDFLINLQNIFLGLVPLKAPPVEEIKEEIKEELDGIPVDFEGKSLEELVVIPKSEDLDGKPLSDLDGDPLDEDVDGIPLATEKVDDLDGKPLEEEKVVSKFVASKWESVDEAELKAQAMTTSKWDMLDHPSGDEANPEEESERKEEPDDLDGQPLEDGEASRGTVSDEDSMQGESSDALQRQEMSEARRAKLREIEVKVVKYQDELEAGKRTRKFHMSISEQVQHYRRKLLAKQEMNDSPSWERDRERKRRRSRSNTPPYVIIPASPKRSKRQKSPKRYHRSRSNSRSPYHRSISRSPTRHRHKHKKNRKRDG